MKLNEIAELMPPNVVSFVIGKFFARYVEVLLKDIGMASDISSIVVGVSDPQPSMQVDFETEVNRPPTPKYSKMVALAKQMKLKGTDFHLSADNGSAFSVVLGLDVEMDELDREALRKGFLSVDVKKVTGDIRLEFI